MRFLLLGIACIVASSSLAVERPLSPTHVAPSLPPGERCVILVSIDGFANFYLDDPAAHIPNIRRLIDQGARAEGLVCTFPTVTWPNHTTLITGVTAARHGVIGNNVIDRRTGEQVAYIPDPVLDMDELVRVPTIFDVAHEADLTTAGIVWPATRNAATLDFTVPDMAGDGWQRFGTPAWLDELRAEGIPVDMHAEWVSAPEGGVQRDWMYIRLADNLLRRHEPNLILIHLVKTDHVQHRTGPRTPDAYWSVSYADSLIGELLDSIERTGMTDRVTLLLVSDHGFFGYNRTIMPNVLLREMGLVQMEGSEVAGRDAWVLAQGGGAAVYVLNDERREEILQEITPAVAGLEGIEAVLTPDDFAEYGQPTPDEDPTAPHLWLAARDGYAFSASANGDSPVSLHEPRGTHGYLPDDPDMHGMLVAWGYGIRPGARLPVVSNMDVAPTMAALLGVELPEPDGRVLAEILDLR